MQHNSTPERRASIPDGKSSTSLILSTLSQDSVLGLNSDMKEALLMYSGTARCYFTKNPFATTIDVSNCGPVRCTEALLKWIKALHEGHVNENIPFQDQYSFCILIGLFESAIGLRLSRHILLQFEAPIYRTILHRDMSVAEMLALEELFTKHHPSDEIYTEGLDLIHEVLVASLATRFKRDELQLAFATSVLLAECPTLQRGVQDLLRDGLSKYTLRRDPNYVHEPEMMQLPNLWHIILWRYAVARAHEDKKPSEAAEHQGEPGDK